MPTKASFCSGGWTGGKVTWHYQEDDGQRNEIDVRLAPKHQSRRRMLLAAAPQVSAAPQGSHTQLPHSDPQLKNSTTNQRLQQHSQALRHERRLPEEEDGAYMDNGYICYQQPNSWYILRREVFTTGNPPANAGLENAEVATTLQDALLGMVTGAVNEQTINLRIGTGRAVGNTIYDANLYLLPAAGHNYVVDLDINVEYYDGNGGPSATASISGTTGNRE